MLKSESHGHAAIDGDDLAGDVAGGRAGEESDDFGDVLGFAESGERDLGDDRVFDGLGQLVGHVGGDESLINNWLLDPEVVAWMKSKEFVTTKEVFIYFMQEVEKIINGMGKKMVTWDDAFAFDPEQATQATVMSWRGDAIAQIALDHGREVVQGPVFPTYFDYSQEVSTEEPGGGLDDALSTTEELPMGDEEELETTEDSDTEEVDVTDLVDGQKELEEKFNLCELLISLSFTSNVRSIPDFRSLILLSSMSKPIVEYFLPNSTARGRPT